MKIVLSLILILVISFFGYSNMKKAPSEAICYAAYTHYDGDILVALKYKALAENDYIKIAEDLNKRRSKLLASQAMILEKVKFLSRNELFKYSDFLRCKADAKKI